MKNILVFVLGYALDLVLGDPYYIYHPVTLISKLISFFEKTIKTVLPKCKIGQRIGGGIVVVLTLLTVTFSVILLLKIFYYVNFYIGFAVEVFLANQVLATKCLKDESMKVYFTLSKNIKKAREAVGRIVGRDTSNLTKEGVIKATVETVAENTSDGVIAPMLYLAIGGIPLAMLYKAVNTMDSMMGYKNEKYQYFGTFAAKVDDLFNFIPSRITALQMIISACLLGLDYKNAVKIFLRDRNFHSSPNAGQPESVAAGALGIKLGGDAFYFGTLHKKHTFGDSKNKVEPQNIKTINKLLYTTSILSFFMFLALKLLILI